MTENADKITIYIPPDVVTKRHVVPDVFTLKECLSHLNLDTEKGNVFFYF